MTGVLTPIQGLLSTHAIPQSQRAGVVAGFQVSTGGRI